MPWLAWLSYKYIMWSPAGPPPSYLWTAEMGFFPAGFPHWVLCLNHCSVLTHTHTNRGVGWERAGVCYLHCVPEPCYWAVSAVQAWTSHRQRNALSLEHSCMSFMKEPRCFLKWENRKRTYVNVSEVRRPTRNSGADSKCYFLLPYKSNL